MVTTGINPDGSVRSRLDQLPRQASLAGWPTCREADGEKNVRTLEGALSEMERKGSPQDLCMGAVLTGWPTVTSTDAVRSPSLDFATPNVTLNHAAVLAGWPSPGANDTTGAEQREQREQRSAGGLMLRDIPHLLSGWPTPNCSPDAPNMSQNRGDGQRQRHTLQSLGAMAKSVGPARLTVSGELLTGSTAAMASGGQLNPEHSRWLMGCPEAWALCHPNYNDWRKWQDFLRLHSSAQSSSESEASEGMETPSTQ